MERPTAVIVVSQEELDELVQMGSDNMLKIERKIERIEDDRRFAQFGTIGFDAYKQWILDSSF